jgi:hypothetical protein
LEYFEQNRASRRVIEFPKKLMMNPNILPAFGRSLQRFQAGESGDGKHLRLAAQSTTNQDYCRTIELFIKAENEHARLMGETLRRLGAPLLERHWTDFCFIALRRLFGLKEKLMGRLIPEMIARGYFQIVSDSTHVPTIRNVSNQIPEDEEGYVTFHVDFLRGALSGFSLPRRVITREIWRTAFHLALLVVVFDHRSFLQAISAPVNRFFCDCDLDVGSNRDSVSGLPQATFESAPAGT